MKLTKPIAGLDLRSVFVYRAIVVYLTFYDTLLLQALLLKLKMGLAIITGGRYEIEEEDGMALADISSMPFINYLNWAYVKDAQSWLISELVSQWEVIAHWLVSYRTRAVNTKIFPFTSPTFLDQKAKAKIYSVMLDLCGEIWECEEKIRQIYNTPHDWWVNCIFEIQRNQITEIFENLEGIPKGKIEKNTRDLINCLKKGESPFTEDEENTHLHRVFSYAIKLKKLRYASVKSEWDSFLEALEALPLVLKRDGTKTLIVMGNRVLSRENRNALKLININHVPKELLLDKDAKFSVIAPEEENKTLRDTFDTA